jgi:hypothetical protein
LFSMYHNETCRQPNLSPAANGGDVAGVITSGLPVQAASGSADARRVRGRRFSGLRQTEYLNDIVEQDHRRIERLVRPGPGLASCHTARRTLAGYDIVASMRKGQVSAVPADDMAAQRTFVAALFGGVA